MGSVGALGDDWCRRQGEPRWTLRICVVGFLGETGRMPREVVLGHWGSFGAPGKQWEE
jgi:hypothetical protein